jgi:hypothetical protein
MCITYYLSYTHCSHKKYLGSLGCCPSCPLEARHTFYLNDDVFDYATCAFLQGEEVDPDMAPVRYYPPLFDNDKVVPQLNKEEQEEEEYAAFSDTECSTSGPSQDSIGMTQEYGHPKSRYIHDTAREESSPASLGHRSTVLEQLESLSRIALETDVRTQPCDRQSAAQRARVAHEGVPNVEMAGDVMLWALRVQAQLNRDRKEEGK